MHLGKPTDVPQGASEFDAQVDDINSALQNLENGKHLPVEDVGSKPFVTWFHKRQKAGIFPQGFIAYGIGKGEDRKVFIRHGERRTSIPKAPAKPKGKKAA